jgi:hypothetical protein
VPDFSSYNNCFFFNVHAPLLSTSHLGVISVFIKNCLQCEDKQLVYILAHPPLLPLWRSEIKFLIKIYGVASKGFARTCLTCCLLVVSLHLHMHLLLYISLYFDVFLILKIYLYTVCTVHYKCVS